MRQSPRVNDVPIRTGECLQVRSKCAADQESKGKHLRPEQNGETTELPHKHHREDTTPAWHKPINKMEMFLLGKGSRTEQEDTPAASRLKDQRRTISQTQKSTHFDVRLLIFPVVVSYWVASAKISAIPRKA